MITTFTDSAFRHGYTEEDYEEACRNPRLFIRSRRGIKNAYELLGRNDAGDHLHIATKRFFRDDGEQVIIVFHMNRMSDSERRLYNRRVRR